MDTWTDSDRRALAGVMNHVGHSTVTASRLLAKDFGATVTQATISRWRSGRIDTPRCVDEIRAYVGVHGPQGDKSDGGASGQGLRTPTG